MAPKWAEQGRRAGCGEVGSLRQVRRAPGQEGRGLGGSEQEMGKEGIHGMGPFTHLGVRAQKG